MPAPYRSRLLLPETLPFTDARERRWWYNYRGAGSDDIAALVGELGGNDAVLGIYDARRNVTVSGGAVSAWDDARGVTGFGPQLAQSTGTQRPAYDATAKTLTFDGVDDSLGSASSAAWNLSHDKSLVVVGSGVSGNGGWLAQMHAVADAQQWLGVSLNSVSTGYTGQYKDTAGLSTAGVLLAVGAARRLFVAGKTATSLKFDLPSLAQATATPTGSCGDGNGLLFVGNDRTSTGGKPVAGVIRAVVVLDHQYTAAELAALTAWAVNVHGAVLAT